MPAFEIVNGRRCRVGATTYYSDRIDLEDDYEVIYSHKTSVSAAGHVYEAPLASHMAIWVMDDSWAPGDNHEMALDPTGEWFEEELECEVYESRIFQQLERVDQVPRKLCQRSKTSVSRGVYGRVWGFNQSSQTPSCCLEGTVSLRIPG